MTPPQQLPSWRRSLFLCLACLFLVVGATTAQPRLINELGLQGKAAVGSGDRPAAMNKETVEFLKSTVGQKGAAVVEQIKAKTGLENVATFPQGAPVTMDFRTDRIRVFVDEDGKVARAPRIG